ncbi:MAG: thioredoxin family protein [Proteobacteria bacterium]|nr:thioredoxin family protein [Pseudomonadota bacterium]
MLRTSLRLSLRASLLASALVCLVAAGAMAAPGVLPVPKAGPAVFVPGMVTVVDLGAKTCIPCKMMVPVLEEVEKEYKGRAAVVFIDVTKYSELATQLRVRAIPTQIFYDKKGREVARHEGFMDKKTLSDKLDKMLGK